MKFHLSTPAIVAIVASVPAQGFVDVTASAGLSMPTQNVLKRVAICCGDFDGDGTADLMVPGAAPDPIRLFLNDGLGNFADATSAANLGLSGAVQCMSACDFDNDGDVDVFLGRDGTDSMFVNDGRGGFTDRAAALGVGGPYLTHSASFGDFDRDGWADVYLGVHSTAEPNQLFRNVAGTGFANVSVASGTNSLRGTFVAVFVDFDADGWPDLYVINDKGTQFGGNQLLRNRGDGTFLDVAAAIGAYQEICGMGVDFVDAFNDGGIEFFVSDRGPDQLFLTWDTGQRRFFEAQSTYGLEGLGVRVGWSCNFFDFDNDGWQDLHLVSMSTPNALYHNPATPASAAIAWPNVAAAVGLGESRHQYAAVFADFDEDGRVDVVHAFADGPSLAPGIKLMRNQVTAGHWLRLRARGVDSHRDAFGTRIRLTAGGNTQTQWVRSGVGFNSGSDPRCHFGLGAATQVERIEVTWPLGQTQVLTNVAADRSLTLIEPSLRHAGVAGPGTTTSLQLDVDSDAGLAYAMPVSMLAGPPLALPSGREIPLAFDAVTAACLAPGNPLVPTSVGTLDANGRASTSLHIPPQPSLVGLTIYATALTIDPAEPEAIRTILPRVAIPIE